MRRNRGTTRKPYHVAGGKGQIVKSSIAPNFLDAFNTILSNSKIGFYFSSYFDKMILELLLTGENIKSE